MRCSSFFSFLNYKRMLYLFLILMDCPGIHSCPSGISVLPELPMVFLKPRFVIPVYMHMVCKQRTFHVIPSSVAGIHEKKFPLINAVLRVNAFPVYILPVGYRIRFACKVVRLRLGAERAVL